MKDFRLLLFLLFFSYLNGMAQNDYQYKTFVSPSSQDTLLYRLLTPDSTQENGKYPLVIFLHGAGERGTDNESQLTHGSGMFTNPVNREQYPAYVIFPQCPPDAYWAFSLRPDRLQGGTFPIDYDITPIMFTVKELIDSYISLPYIDNNRIYIIGISMGAMGTYDLTCRFPELFTAAIPICGAVNPERLAAAKGIRFRIFHGDKDEVVPVINSRNVYKKLKAENIPVEYTEFVGCGHDSWNPAFNTQGFMEWLFNQEK